MGLAAYQEMKVSGVFGGGSVMLSNEAQLNNMWAQMDSDQNQIINLVNNDTSLKQRRISVLGQEIANKGIQPPSTDHPIPYM
ncbi:hypothetical protein [Methanobacterium sp. SMA-27]|uniref:hypothetical protein n=1 Tax=Methanobacterium sp. SMA-27 TaxID=1495336 RepID=UPI00064F8002|nr:hypothetical protein [Methanobacterium sp. SMA-27]